MKKIIIVLTLTLTLVFLLCGCSVPKKSYTSIEDYYNSNKTVMNGIIKLLDLYCDDNIKYDITFQDNDIIVDFTVNDVEKNEVTEKYLMDGFYKLKDDFIDFAKSMKDLAEIEEECIVIVSISNDKNEKLGEIRYSSDSTTSEDSNNDLLDSNSNGGSDSTTAKENEDSLVSDDDSIDDRQDESIDSSVLNGSLDDMDYTIDFDGSTVYLNLVMDAPSSQDVKDMLKKTSQLCSASDGQFKSLQISIKNKEGDLLYEQDYSLESERYN